MSDSLTDLILSLTPEDGSSIGNGAMIALLRERIPRLREEDYTAARDALIDDGVLGRGRGRGGSISRIVDEVADDDAEGLEKDDDGFDLTPTEGSAPRKRKTAGRKAARRRSDGPVQVLSYPHGETRVNNPEVGMVHAGTDPDGEKTAWAYDPHLDPVLNFDSARAGIERLIDDALASEEPERMRDALVELKRLQQPYLNWTGKAEKTSFEVDTVSLHVHERVDPATILANAAKRLKGKDAAAQWRQPDMFAAPFENLPLRQALDFYRHEKGWSNRLVAGDSLLVMNSLLTKESMRGKVQMIYIDPPYGIKYGSNFQPFTNKRDVKDRNDQDLTQEPEMIKAFRDTWELGIHSYLTYLRDRLMLARELLTESGSVFVQISDENAHHVRELLEIVDNVGKRGAAGQDLQNVISVAMLSEGWDAKNVTHIMGLRAFTSQLLCEQVVGRGLRRVFYDTDEEGLFLPEYVNVFGVPLSISETGEGGEAPPPPKPTTQIEVVVDRAHFEIRWPNVLRVETLVRPQLTIDWSKVPPLVLDPATTPISAELAPALGGATDMGKVTSIDLEKLPDAFRLQRLVFQAARKAFAELSHGFSGTQEYLAAQLVRIVEAFLSSDRLEIPSLFHFDPLRRRILVALNIDLVVQHALAQVSEQNTERLTPVFDQEKPIGATGQMRTWYTTKPCFPTSKSHISHLVGDSSWEGHAANLLETRNEVIAYAKNDHLGFQVYYMWAGSRRRYVPDFLVRLSDGRLLALEIKGSDSPQNKAKRDALNEWVKAINGVGGFGRWAWDVAFKPSDVHDIITKHSAVAEPVE